MASGGAVSAASAGASARAGAAAARAASKPDRAAAIRSAVIASQGWAGPCRQKTPSGYRQRSSPWRFGFPPSPSRDAAAEPCSAHPQAWVDHRLTLKNIQPGTADTALFKRISKGFFIDDITAGSIDHNTCRLHGRQGFGPRICIVPHHRGNAG